MSKPTLCPYKYPLDIFTDIETCKGGFCKPPLTPKTKSRADQKMRLEIRCNDEEKNLWKKQAELAGLSLSEFVRLSLDESKVITDVSSQKLQHEKNIQIARIGSNLNQIARGRRGKKVLFTRHFLFLLPLVVLECVIKPNQVGF